MKKQLIICAITILLLMLGLSGCFGDSNKDKGNGKSPEVNLFIGKWKTTPYDIYENGTRFNENFSNSTFYTNGTMGSESVVSDEIIWTPYVIENNQICFGEANTSDYLCYDYNFSNNGNKATLVTFYQDPYSDSGETIEIVVEMIKI
ncbi:Uncharacterised protein [uncultured archaeon]|nr:Uncharacterised protein [uncultured archaeon]